jgi:hypothetical protein
MAGQLGGWTQTGRLVVVGVWVGWWVGEGVARGLVFLVN